VRVIAKRTLREFWEKPDCVDAEQPLKAWYSEARSADWKKPQDIKEQYRQASFVKDNKYRLIVKINYPFGIVYVRFIGTHKQYDAIDAETV
jgi:mRNA interferase HigB